MPTVQASFAGGEKFIDTHENAPIPLRLVQELPLEFSPVHVTDGFRQLMIPHHIFHLQTLQHDHLVFVDNACREFVREVLPNVSNFRVNVGDLQTGLVAVF